MDSSFLICLLCLLQLPPLAPLPPNSSYLVLISGCVLVQIYSRTLSSRPCLRDSRNCVVFQRAARTLSGQQTIHFTTQTYTEHGGERAAGQNSIRAVLWRLHKLSCLSSWRCFSCCSHVITASEPLLERQRSGGCPTSRTRLWVAPPPAGTATERWRIGPQTAGTWLTGSISC